MDRESLLAFWTIVAGVLCNSACAILGCYMVLRRMSLLGDAISHAVLPGTVIAVVWSGQLVGWQVFAGAVAVGILTAFLTQALSNFGNVPEDSSMGVVFTSLFALGVILLNQYASQVDLDPGCVLYGLIEFVPLDTVQWLGMEIPRAIFSLATVAGLTVLFVTVLWKELKIVSFDAALATAMGISAITVHYLLMAMVAVVTVASFEAVGSILVIAMLIVPPATAHLLTDRLVTMQILAVGCACLSAILGYYLAEYWNTSVAGMMSVVAGGLFTISVIFAPQHGLLVKVVRKWRLTVRIIKEDILAVLYREEERGRRDGRETRLARGVCIRFAGGGLLARWVIPLMRGEGLIVDAGEGCLALTDTGRRRAESLVRSHRLWEAYLERYFELPRDHLHEPASRIEHFLGPNLQQEISEELAAPTQDPHGQVIPKADLPGTEKA